MLHVKLTVYYTVSSTCNIYFLNSTYSIFNQFKGKNIRGYFAAEYIKIIKLSKTMHTENKSKRFLEYFVISL